MMKVMLADDEPIVRKALQTLPDWKALHCEIVYTASNGKEVLEHLEEYMPDILITDIKMPGADGIELARHIWEQKLPIKVIILTAYADFSYAQSAIRYDVAEYITKTGVLNGLEDAVRKCRDQLETEKRPEKEDAASLAAENFFRAVLDGSLYEEAEINNKCNTFGLRLSHYRVMIFSFRLPAKKEAKQRIYSKAVEFLDEVFETRIIKRLFVKKDMLCVILFDANMTEEELKAQCKSIVEMADSFLHVKVGIGSSLVKEGAEKLREAYKEAEDILRSIFLDETAAVRFYTDGLFEKNLTFPELEIRIDDICREIQKGDGGMASELFKQLLSEQTKAGCRASVIKDTGMSIQNRCRRLLAEYDNTVSYEEGHKRGVAQSIYDCIYAADYEEIMLELIKNTALITGTVRSRKNDMVAECEHYIGEHYADMLTVALIAEHIGTSISYLSRIFREVTGNTVIATINSLKLEKAKEYLEQTDMRVYEIAEALGFEHVTYFSHFFKKQTGVTPKDWIFHKK